MTDNQTPTLSVILVRLLDANCRVEVVRDRLHVVPPKGLSLSGDLAATIRTAEPALTELVGLVERLRAVLRRMFRARRRGDHDAVAELRPEYRRLVSEIGPTLARFVEHAAADRWTRRTGTCAWCGIGQEFHMAPAVCATARRLHRQNFGGPGAHR